MAEHAQRSFTTPAPGLRFLILGGLSLVLLIADQRSDYLDSVRKAIGAAVYPLRVAVDTPVSLWRWVGESTASRNELVLELSRLRTEKLITQARLMRYAALEAENARLRAMLGARERVRERVQVAEIMSVSTNPFRHVMVVDKGTRDGAFEGQAIIDADGVVGQVIEAGLLSSQAMLISDPDHALPVQVNRSGVRTIAVGTGEHDRLDLPFLPNNADIHEGDLLVTSGLGGAFPPGYPVGTVRSVIRVPQNPFAEVSATPAASLGQIREVMLIWPGENEPGDDAAAAEAPGPADAPPESAADTTADE
ncbi:MAG TPA: rod shape-determining protein MreC [Woeseiaceae bacterium]|nr:rod shape-determining protein MreC [Woeseiaceae bacterium]